MKNSVARMIVVFGLSASLLAPLHSVSFAHSVEASISGDSKPISSNEERVDHLSAESVQVKSESELVQEAPESFWKKHRKKIIAATVVFVAASLWVWAGAKKEKKIVFITVKRNKKQYLLQTRLKKQNAETAEVAKNAKVLRLKEGAPKARRKIHKQSSTTNKQKIVQRSRLRISDESEEAAVLKLERKNAAKAKVKKKVRFKDA